MDTQRPIGFWLKLVDLLITEEFARSLEEHGVTRLQWQLLNVLGSGPATAEDLSRMVAPLAAQQTVTDEPTDPRELLGELVESGWVSLTEERYELTERGTSSLETLGAVVEKVRLKAVNGIAAEEYQAAIHTLERMATNLGWQGD